MIITVDVQSRAWSAGMDDLMLRIEDATRAASLDGAEEIRDVARAKLVALRHGEFTDTPSRPGEPPAMISGALAGSMSAELFGDQAWVGPTSLPYARIQELGGGMHGHPVMQWHRLFEGHLVAIKAAFVELPLRPYLEPSTNDVVDSGRLTEIYVEHWTAAIEGG